MEPEKISFKCFIDHLKSAKIFFIIFAILFIAELACSQILPRLIPQHWYLKAYLPWRSVAQTQRFLRGDLDIEPDPVRGWRNKKNAKYLGIKYDKYGSRSYNGLADEKTPKKWRMIFLGDSRVNGYTYVNNSQTINACMENSDVEALNLATAFYGLDQIYLTMQEALKKFNPNVVVIGLGSEIEQLLDSQYIPFLLRREYGMPFLKPRYILENKKLILQKPPFRTLLKNVPNSPKLLSYLKEHDGHYEQFQQFQKWGSTPFLGLFSIANKTFQKWQHTIKNHISHKENCAFRNSDLMRALVRAIHKLGQTKQVSVCFVLFPRLDEFQGYRRKAYQKTAALLRSESLGFIDGLSLLRGYRGSQDLFGDDSHVTYAANQLLASAIANSMLIETSQHPIIAR